MPESPPLVRDISDTALWAANYRAKEALRPDALFHDPLAHRLAGARGQAIAQSMPGSRKHAWSWVVRTHLFDQLVLDHVRVGGDMVINLAAGLDTRPYRLGLPATLQWVEVDLPGLLAYKREKLENAEPTCALETVALDLVDVAGRRSLFARLAECSRKAMILSEGLIIYFEEREVLALGRDLSGHASFQAWIVDLCSPGLLRILQKQLNPKLNQGSAPLKFGPSKGPDFFSECGWRAQEVHSLLHVAARLRRLPLLLRLFALIPPPKGPAGNRPWGGVLRLGRM